MSNPIGATLHGKALLAFGFDLASLRRSMELPGARWFLSGFYPSARGPRHVGAECLASPGSVQCYGHRGPTLPWLTLWAVTTWSGNIYQEPTVA